jgi:hypothetical protein
VQQVTLATALEDGLDSTRTALAAGEMPVASAGIIAGAMA